MIFIPSNGLFLSKLLKGPALLAFAVQVTVIAKNALVQYIEKSMVTIVCLLHTDIFLSIGIRGFIFEQKGSMEGEILN